MGKRLFIAVHVDEKTQAQVTRVSVDVRQALGSVTASWVRPDRLHLTLYFCGNSDAAVEQRARDALARPIAESPFSLAFSGLGFFPERGSPRVVWLGVGDGLGTLRRVRHILAGRIDDHGGPPRGGESFSPHLTLGRLRERVARANMAHLGDIPSTARPSRIDRVTLYESRLSPQGPTYIPMAAAELQP